jgi:glutaredoxin
MAVMKIHLYGLSTCGWCAKARAWLDENAGEYDLTYVDKLQGAELEKAKQELTSKGLRLSFPIVFFDDEAVVGYRPDEYERITGG